MHSPLHYRSICTHSVNQPLLTFRYLPPTCNSYPYLP
uniref:Uncharacterized protein n=1 Tax=Amphimedon queenslandica TaxID=400682 RepID=A0A1X7SE42_AMPQE